MAQAAPRPYLWRVIHVVHHPDYVTPAPPGSRYPWNKNGLVRDLLRDSGAPIAWHTPEPMPSRAIETVHDADYVAQVAAADVPPDKERRIGFKVTSAVACRAFVVPGGTLLAARLALAHGFAANTAGGSHHALAGTGAGYCVFNDLAIAAAWLAGEGRRVLVVDCDVHQGDGTASLLAGRADVATYSIHADKNFPVRKARSTLDVGLPDGTGDEDYLDTLATTLPPLVADFAPDIILYQAGVDPYAGDRLGRLSLTLDGLLARDRWVGAFARGLGLPLASTLGGGYGTDMLEVARRHVAATLTLGESTSKEPFAPGRDPSTLAAARAGV